MRTSKMLQKFRGGGFARVCALGHYLPFYVRYAAHFGFDGIWFDLEHRAMDGREVQSILAMCRQHNIDCMVRPPTREHTQLYRYLEDGAAGFLVPLVSDPQTAADLVQAIKYPPLGNRGLDGAGIDGDFGIDVWFPESTYIEDANRETFILTQVETLEAVANAEEIAAIPGVDGLFIGPADLNLRIASGKAGHGMTMEKAIETVAAAAAQHGKVWGITAGSLADIQRFREMGAQIVPWGGDFALRSVLEACSQDLDQVPGA
ncbi:MAG: aldolase/citrate lyase family protein [Litorilinea sp.]